VTDQAEEPKTLDTGWLEELTLFAQANAEELEEARAESSDGN
jgi:hypothetical protein